MPMPPPAKPSPADAAGWRRHAAELRLKLGGRPRRVQADQPTAPTAAAAPLPAERPTTTLSDELQTQLAHRLMQPVLLEDEIGRKLAEAQRSGELQSAAGWGKPLAEDEAWQQTPDALRMPFRILQRAGVLPPEVELLQQRASLRAELAAAADPAEARTVQVKLAAVEQRLALGMEALARRR
jgi:hypothetical protein